MDTTAGALLEPYWSRLLRTYCLGTSGQYGTLDNAERSHPGSPSTGSMAGVEEGYPLAGASTAKAASSERVEHHQALLYLHMQLQHPGIETDRRIRPCCTCTGSCSILALRQIDCIRLWCTCTGSCSILALSKTDRIRLFCSCTVSSIHHA